MAKSKGWIAQRLPEIVKHRNFRWSALAGVIVVVLLCGLRVKPRHPDIKVVELAGPILTFTSMGFAIALAAVALILARPLDRMTALMVVNSRRSPPTQVIEDGDKFKIIVGEDNAEDAKPADHLGNDSSAYVDLVSVFLITALANVVASGVTIVWTVTVGGDPLLTSHSIENSLLTGLVVMTLTYAGAQMVTSVGTLYQVAGLADQVMRTKLKDNDSRSHE